MRKRNIQCSIRMTEQEMERLKKLCRCTGLSQAAVIRSLISGKELKEKKPEGYRELVRKVSGVSNNLNQIARQANATGMVAQQQLADVQRLMKQLWALLREGL